jgi:exopolysaccharide biosynthesis polyprenyl glycosylphosphotransferase
MSSIGVESPSTATQAAALPVASRPRLGRVLERFETLFTSFEVAADLIMVAVAAALAYATYDKLNLGRHVQYQWRGVVGGAFVFSLFFVLMLDREGAYQKATSLLRIRETERVLRASTTTFLLAFPVTFFAAKLLSRWAMVLAFIFVPLLVIAEKQLVFMAVRSLHARGVGVKKVVIYGAGFTGRHVLSALGRSPKVGLQPLAIVDDDSKLAGGEAYEYSYKRAHPVPIVAGPVTNELLRALGAEMLVVAIPSLSREKLAEVQKETAAVGAQFAFLPSQTIPTDLLTECTDIDGLLLSSFAPPVPNRLYESSKRLFDFLVAALLLLFLSPLLLAIAVMIRLDSPGPALFRQKRAGKNGKLFDMYKFRSMHTQACGYAFSPKELDDPRITRAGRFLRRTSFDELPQIINVLKGEMSLVGPRPEMPFIVEQYKVRERQRLQVTPGITGLWQLSADRAFLIHENIQYDLYYIRHRSFFMDLAILMHTAVFAMRGV